MCSSFHRVNSAKKSSLSSLSHDLHCWRCLGEGKSIPLTYSQLAWSNLHFLGGEQPSKARFRPVTDISSSFYIHVLT